MQKVVDSIIRQTEAKGDDKLVCSSEKPRDDLSDAWRSDQSSKVILAGPKVGSELFYTEIFWVVRIAT